LKSSKLCRTTASLREACPVSLHRTLLFHPCKRLPENLGGADVRWHDDAIVHPLAFASSFDDACTAKICQMPRYFGLELLQNLYEVANANFLVTHEIEQTKSGAVAQSLKEPFHIELRRFRCHELTYTH